MNKRSLNRYYEYIRSSRNDSFKGKYCVLDSGKYIITNSYSFIVFNDLVDTLDSKYDDKTTDTLKGFDDKFNKFIVKDDITSKVFDTLEHVNGKTKNTYCGLSSKFSLNMDLFSRVYNLIKCDEVIMLVNNNDLEYMEVVVKCVNSKTSEYAYLLPCRTF